MSVAQVSELYVKPEQKPCLAVENLVLDTRGVEGGRLCHPWKQLLLISKSSLEQFDVTASDLNVDLVLDAETDIHDLPSGSVIQIGDVRLRLTFHCEPCAKIKHLGNIKKFTHHRGVHSQILTPGEIKLGDAMQLLTDEQYPRIPYRFSDRIKWYLEQHPEPIYAAELVDRIGFSASYCRAIPRAIKGREDIDPALILFKKRAS